MGRTRNLFLVKLCGRCQPVDLSTVLYRSLNFGAKIFVPANFSQFLSGKIVSMCSLKRSLQTGGSCSKELGQREETETNDWPSEQYAQPLLESMIYVARRQRIVAPARSTI